MVAVGGTPTTKEQMHLARKIFPHSLVLQAYGMTEQSGAILAFNPRKFAETKSGSAGMPCPGVTCKIVDLETELTLGPNQKGEFRFKSPYMMNGYHNRDASEAWDSEGWIRTGDIAYFDEDGCFYIVDRIKEMLKFRSWHVTPSAIEKILTQHPSVTEAVIIGIPHDVDGDLAMGIVVLNDKGVGQGIEEELIQFVADRVGFRDRLHGGLKIVESIPRTPSGKTMRRDLRIMAQEGRL